MSKDNSVAEEIQGWDDEKTSLHEIRLRIRRFLEARDWGKHHSPKNLSMSIAIEAAELMEIFQWIPSEDARAYAKDHPGVSQHIQEEVSDVVIYCLSLANTLGFDLAQAIDDKIVKNATKYPVEDAGSTPW